MKKLVILSCFILFANSACAQQKPWQRLSMPQAKDVAAHFHSPPLAYAVQHHSGRLYGGLWRCPVLLSSQ